MSTLSTLSVKNPLVPDFEIRIDGSSLPVDFKTRLVRLVVDDDTTIPSMFTLEFADLAEKDKPQIKPNLSVDESLFDLGNEVEIKLGYKGKLKSLIVGEITGLDADFTAQRPPCLTVRGYDRRHRLQRGRKTRTFVKQKDSDIATQIAREAKLSPRTKDSRVIHDYLFQANQTDMEFLQARAQQIQYELVVEKKTLLFRPVSNSRRATVTLTLNDDLLEFHPLLSSAGQASEVSVRGWDPKNKKAIVGKANAGDEVSRMGGRQAAAAIAKQTFGKAAIALDDWPVLTQAEADQQAKAYFNRAALTLIEGDGLCRGRADLRAGQMIEIEGVGQRFSGQYYVARAIHRYSQSGYYTQFQVRRNAS